MVWWQWVPTACALLALLVTIIAADEFQSNQAPDYAIPNPFKDISRGFYHLAAQKTVNLTHGEPERYSVEEYFSLESGISFSIFRPMIQLVESQKPSVAWGEAWVVVTDGRAGRMYILDNFDSPDEVQCELDDVHSHRHIYPWLYEYNLKPSGLHPDGLHEKRKFKAALYGIGAIWLNMIEQGLRSSQVGRARDSKNVWTLDRDQYESLYLEFEGVPCGPEASDGDFAARMDSSKLSKLVITSKAHMKHTEADQESVLVSHDFREESYQLDGPLESELAPRLDSQLWSLLEHLDECRKGVSKKRRRVFPSLAYAASIARHRAVDLQYIARRSRLWPDANYSGHYDDARHRDLGPIELSRELFSLTEESSKSSYEVLPLNEDSGRRVDTYLKRFTQLANEHRSSRHSTAHYHLIEWVGRSKSLTCLVGEAEPMPRSHLFVRPVHFHRTYPDIRLSGHLTGLMALIMNVANFNHKTVDLRRRRLEVNRNPYDLDELDKVLTTKWTVHDQKSGWTIELYFKVDSRSQSGLESGNELPELQSFSSQTRDDISHLVRVDILDPNQLKGHEDEQLGAKQLEELQLVARFDIIQLTTVLGPQDDYSHLFLAPQNCHPKVEQDAASSDDDDYVDDDEHYHNSDYYNKYIASESDSDDDEAPDQKRAHQIDQLEAEDLEAGQLSEDNPLPDFFEAIDGRPAYEIWSRIELEHEQSDAERRFVYLHELVDLEQEVAFVRVFNTNEPPAEDGQTQPDHWYYINYASEIMFESSQAGTCNYVDELQAPADWLRLFTSQYSYYVVANSAGLHDNSKLMDYDKLVESSKLPMFGVGGLWRLFGERQNTEFLGKRHRQFVDPKTGKNFTQLVWAGLDDDDLQISFNFLLANHLKHSHWTSVDRQIRLHFIEWSNVFDGEYQTSFDTIRAHILSVAGQDSSIRTVPSECLDQYRMSHAHRDTHMVEAEMPSFWDFLGDANGYHARFTLIHGDSTDADHRSQEVTEEFDRSRNRGRMRVERAGETGELYIEGQARKLLAYVKKLNECKEIDNVETFVELKPTLECRNNDFEVDKMYSLAALWIQLSKLKHKVRVLRPINWYGMREELHIYTMEVDTSIADEHYNNLTIKAQQQVRAIFKNRAKVRKKHAALVEPSDWFKGKIKERKHNPLELRSIHLLPLMHNGMPVVPQIAHGVQFKSHILIESMVPVSFARDDDLWQLPAPCQSLLNDAPVQEYHHQEQVNSDRPTRRQEELSAEKSFPRLPKLSPGEQFHVRSELVMKKPGDMDTFSTFERVATLDEWFEDSRIRMRSRALRGLSLFHDVDMLDFDWILDLKTGEVFDISKPFRCKQEFPQRSFMRPKPNTREFWLDEEKPLINHPSHLYYGPLALWMLAERNLANVELKSSVDLSPIPDSESRFDPNNREKELQAIIWRVSSPKQQSSSSNRWSYDIKFNKMLVVDENTHQDIVYESLDSIEFQFQDQEPNGFRSAFVQVIDEHHHPASSSHPDLFILPSGWGCVRTEKASTYDDFIDVEPYGFGYEASFEVLEKGQLAYNDHDDDISADQSQPEQDPEDRPKPSSRATGTFYHWVKVIGGESLGFKIHESRINAFDGTVSSNKFIYDPDRRLLYELDLISGSCGFGSRQTDPQWTLSFTIAKSNDSRKVETITIDERSFYQIFTNSQLQQYHFLHSHSSANGRTVTSKFEKAFDGLEISDTFRGPVSVVRTYSYDKLIDTQVDRRYSSVVRTHKEMRARVYFFDQGRENLLAVLNVALHSRNGLKLTNLLQHANIYHCLSPHNQAAHDQRFASFTILYQLKPGPKYQIHFSTDSLLRNFYSTLLEATTLWPLQLDGKARIEFSNDNDNMAQIHFNVLEPPPAHMSFKTFANSTISDHLLALAETRLLPSIDECSSWCSRLDCIVMSYCRDQMVCNVVLDRVLRRSHTKRVVSTQAGLAQLLESGHKNANSCSYHYKLLKHSGLSLSKLHDQLDGLVNLPTKDSQSFQVPVNKDNRLVPMSFHSTEGKFLWTKDATRDTGADMEAVAGQSEFVYGVIRNDHAVDLTNSNQVLVDQSSGQRVEQVFSVVEANNLASCLDACEAKRCLLVSYCKQSTSSAACIMIIPSNKAANERSDHIKLLLASFTRPQSQCSIYMHDFRSKYAKVEDTQVPRSYSLKLDGYSSMECALACQYRGTRCLSFDQCNSAVGPTSNNKAASYPGDDYQSERLQVCFLQSTHLEMQTFDRSTLVSGSQLAENSQYNGTDVECDHYSKSVMADFTRFPNKRLTQHSYATIRGSTAEQCGLDCYFSEGCRAFEHCFSITKDPPHTCHLINSDDVELELKGRTNPTGADHLVRSSKMCSIYLLKVASMEHELNQTLLADWHAASSSSWLSISSNNWLVGSLVFSGYLVAAIMVGLLIQIAYMRLVGRPIGYHPFA